MNLWIVSPAELSALGIDSVHHAPGARGIDDAVFHQRRRFQTARGSQFAAPSQSQLSDRLLINLVQGTEPVVVIGSSVHHPVSAVMIRAPEAVVVESLLTAAGTEE